MRMTTCVAAILCALVPAMAQAQSYPEKAVTMILPTGSGTSMDTLGRFLADGLSKRWNQTVVTENRPGAGGVLGSSLLTNAKPDGYTIMLISSTFSTNALSKDLPFDPEKDFTPIAAAARGDMGIVGGNRIGGKDLASVVEYAKVNKVFYGTTGLTAASRFAAEILADGMGVEMEPVTYTSSTDVMVDIGGGRLDLYVGAVASILPSVDNEKIIPLAVMSENRSTAWPDVPTTTEAGFPDAKFDLYWGVFGPAGVDQALVTKLNEDINAIMTAPEATEYLAKLGGFASPMTADEFANYVKKDIETLSAIANAD